ncbi:hypothetical protein EVAR_93182_1 [Eumeta japonica]|uniref:Uncharacterized protein n=1 Tax=Eumeta variegata TaxID=151549 RepID=A0A4C1TG92_EUMVA|nr:hypothetical protein EVAR_93182_1 [Eumeta japonica]
MKATRHDARAPPMLSGTRYIRQAVIYAEGGRRGRGGNPTRRTSLHAVPGVTRVGGRPARCPCPHAFQFFFLCENVITS